MGEEEILMSSVIVDSHSDLMFDLLRQRERGRKHVLEKDYLDDFKKGGVSVVVAAIFISDEFLPGMALRRALNQINALYEELEESKDAFSLCCSYNEIVAAMNEDKIAILISFEGVEPLYNDISLLNVFYQLGVRLVGLTWSRRNFAADGCSYGNVEEGKKGGLTGFGVDIVKRAEELGMIIDVAHLNDEGFWDVMEYSNQPVIASHSNCRSLVNIARNLSDEQIKAIAKSNGVIGINCASIMVSDETDFNANIEGFVDHIDHIGSLVGYEHIGFGFDFCDRIMKYFSGDDLEGLERKPFDVINSHADIPNIVAEMKKRDFRRPQLDNILGINYMNIFKKVLL